MSRLCRAATFADHTRKQTSTRFVSRRPRFVASRSFHVARIQPSYPQTVAVLRCPERGRFRVTFAEDGRTRQDGLAITYRIERRDCSAVTSLTDDVSETIAGLLRRASVAPDKPLSWHPALRVSTLRLVNSAPLARLVVSFPGRADRLEDVHPRDHEVAIITIDGLAPHASARRCPCRAHALHGRVPYRTYDRKATGLPTAETGASQDVGILTSLLRNHRAESCKRILLRDWTLSRTVASGAVSAMF